MRAKDDSPEAKRDRAEKAFNKQELRAAQVTVREQEEAARVAEIDEKTARLKVLRLQRDAGEVAAKEAAAKATKR